MKLSRINCYVASQIDDNWVILILHCMKLQVSAVSVVYSQSELLQKEVFLVELVDSIYKSKESMSHLKAVYFLRPTSVNIQHLRRQLANPRFGEYHLCKFIKFVDIMKWNIFFGWKL